MLNRCFDTLSRIALFVADKLGRPSVDEATFADLVVLHDTAIDAYRALAEAAGDVADDPCIEIHTRDRMVEAIHESLAMLSFGLPAAEVKR